MTEYEGYLAPLKKRFAAAAVLLLVVGTVCVSQHRSRLQLENTLESLNRARSGFAKVKAANENRRQVLTLMQSQFGLNASGRSQEMILYTKVDELKASLKADDMTISAVEKRGGEASIQYSLTFNNPDFNNLLNTISALHVAVFPQTPVSSIAVTQTDVKGNGSVSFRVIGKIISSEKQKP
jgi:hypothetical protein